MSTQSQKFKVIAAVNQELRANLTRVDSLCIAVRDMQVDPTCDRWQGSANMALSLAITALRSASVQMTLIENASKPRRRGK